MSSSLKTGPRLFSTPTTMQGWVLFDNSLYCKTNIREKGKVVCGARELQGLNLYVNPGLSFAGKI